MQTPTKQAPIRNIPGLVRIRQRIVETLNDPVYSTPVKRQRVSNNISPHKGDQRAQQVNRRLVFY